MSDKEFDFTPAEVIVVGDGGPHVCVVVPPFEPVMPVGSILRCECGRYYERRPPEGDSWGHEYWRQVRRWHRSARRRIREAGASS